MPIVNFKNIKEKMLQDRNNGNLLIVEYRSKIPFC